MTSYDNTQLERQLSSLFRAEAQDAHLPLGTWQEIAPKMGAPDRRSLIDLVRSSLSLPLWVNPMQVRYVAPALTVLLAVLIALLFVLLLNNPDDDDEGTPAPASSPTVPVPAQGSGLCGGPINRLDADPVFAVNDDSNGYVWVLPDGTDAGLTADQLRDADPESDSSTVIRMPRWGSPAIRPDHTMSAVPVERRYSGEPQAHYLVVISTESEPVSGVVEFPREWTQPLITTFWLAESGCLAAMVFNAPDGDLIQLVDADGDVVRELDVQLGRGTVLDGAGADWVLIDRTMFGDLNEVEFLNIEDPTLSIVVDAEQIVPELPGLLGAGELTAAQLVAELRSRSVSVPTIATSTLEGGATPAPESTSAAEPGVTPVPTSSPTVASPTATPSPSPEPTATNPASSSEWQALPPLAHPRSNHHAVALLDGRVLVFGGHRDGNFILESEIFDPATGEWSSGGFLNRARDQGTHVQLLSDGRVLAVNRGEFLVPPENSTEIYDPATNTWELVGSQKGDPTAFGPILNLSDGRAMIVTNGVDPALINLDYILRPEVFDPISGEWTILSQSPFADRSFRSEITGSQITPGGTFNNRSRAVAFMDEMTFLWTDLPEMQFARGAVTTVELADGRQMVIGGIGGNFAMQPELTTEIFDPVTQTWELGDDLAAPACYARARTLDNGDVVVAGVGWSIFCEVALHTTAQRWDISEGVWESIELPVDLQNTATAILADGTVIVTGGMTGPLTFNESNTYVLPGSAWN